MTYAFDYPWPPMSFVCLDSEHNAAMARLRQGICKVARHCPELRLVVLSGHCVSSSVGAFEVTWLMEGSREIDLVPKRLAGRAAALMVERLAAEVLGNVLDAAFKHNLDSPMDALDIHVVLTADAVDAAVLAGPHGEALCIAETTRDVFYQGGVHAFPLLFEVPNYFGLIEHLDRSMERTVLILKQLAGRYLPTLPGDEKQDRPGSTMDEDEIDAMLDCCTHFIDMRILGLDQFVHSRRRKPLPFPLRALPRSSPLGHVFSSSHDIEGAARPDGGGDALDGMEGVS